MEKILKDDSERIAITQGITIKEFNDIYYRLIKELKDKHGYITDIKIHAISFEYNDGEDYVEQMNICYKRYETDEEFETRKDWHESMAIRQKEHDINKMKECIEKYPEIASRYLNELNKK